MATTPPTATQIDAWLDSWMANNWAASPSGVLPAGSVLTFVVCAWTLNDGTQVFQLLDPTVKPPGQQGYGVNAIPDPVQMQGLQLTYGVAVRVYQYTIPTPPSASSIVASSTVQAQYQQTYWAVPS